MQATVDGAVLISVVLALALAVRDRRPGPPRGSEAAGRRLPGPLAWLGVVTGIVLVNQVAVVVYVERVRGGDPAFVARYLPPGWFDLPDSGGPLGWLVTHWPWPHALAVCVLRVQAALELPLVLLAFAVVLRWLDPLLCRRVLRSPLLVVAALAYTAVFCAVEWDLHNPYTLDDLVVRCASALVTPPALAALARRWEPTGAAPTRPLPAVRLLLFLGALAAFGGLVLLVYDTLLLYNLGRLDERLPLAAACAAVLAGCRLGLRRHTARTGPGPSGITASGLGTRTGPRPGAGPPPGPAVAFLGHALRRFLVLFFAPALAVRYGVTFGTPALAAAAGLVLGSVAAGLALRDTLAEGDTGPGPLLAVLGCAVLGGAATGYAAVRVASGGYYETALLAGAATFLAVAVGVCALGDRLRAGSRVSPRPSGASHQQPGDPVGDRQRRDGPEGTGGGVARPRRPEDPLLTQPSTGPGGEGYDDQG